MLKGFKIALGFLCKQLSTAGNCDLCSPWTATYGACSYLFAARPESKYFFFCCKNISFSLCCFWHFYQKHRSVKKPCPAILLNSTNKTEECNRWSFKATSQKILLNKDIPKVLTKTCLAFCMVTALPAACGWYNDVDWISHSKCASQAFKSGNQRRVKLRACQVELSKETGKKRE